MQTFKNFEVCISDDHSTDGREKELLDFLQKSGLSFIYKKQEKNLKYDANTRGSIDLARGKYCFLQGSDDCLTLPTVLDELHTEIQKYESVGVVITNFENWKTGKITRRVRRLGFIGSGPEIAAKNFRDVAFFSGIIIDRIKAQKYRTDKWDGSEMYQMYIVSKIIASGSKLLALDISAVRQDIQIANQSIDDYVFWPRVNPCPIIERRLPMNMIARVVTDAIRPYLGGRQRGRIIQRILIQLLIFTYPFWIVEYKRVQSFKYSLGVCLGWRPRNIAKGLELNLIRRLYISSIYGVVTFAGLLIPIKVFDFLYPIIYPLAKLDFWKR